MNKLFFLIIFLSGQASFGQQVDTKLLCSGRWFPVQYEEADGTVVQLDKENQDEYVEYKPDGIFSSIEGKTTLKGKWTYNAADQTVVVTQNMSRHYPAKIVSKVLELTDDHLVIVSEDAGGAMLKLYMVHHAK